MNQINLDKLLQLNPALKADTAQLKLIVAQVYQAQVQQLTTGAFSLKLPAADGALHIALPAALPADIRGAVQVQFQAAANGQLQLILQNASQALKLPLSSVQASTLLAAILTPNASAGLQDVVINRPTSAASLPQIPISLLRQPQGISLRLPDGSLQPLSTATQSAINQLLPATAPAQLAAMLQLPTATASLSLQLSAIRPAGPDTANNSHPPVSASAAAPASIVLHKTEQLALLQRLVQLFNQQGQSPAFTATATTTPVQAVINQVLAALPTLPQAPAAPHQAQLQLHANQWQLILQSLPQQVNLTISPEALSKPLQLLSNNSAAPAAVMLAPAGTTAADKPPQLQQAWRNLLPLLPPQADLLASLPELPEPVQRILQLVRQSQPGASKVLSPQQLASQLTSLLQFQPLQPAATAQSSGGTLAVAIQLLLGHLLQKPQTAAATPANKPLAQLISQLEPGQASSLLRQLAGHSSKLQHSQLATLDSPQQQLLLQLPLQQGEHSVFSQILLEQREADGKAAGEKQTLWQLTLKFDLQQLGQLMVVARLQQQQLQLQFYTEQQHTQQLAQRFLPLLKDRCRVQGLEVTQAECTLGKIPDSILPRANSLLALKV